MAPKAQTSWNCGEMGSKPCDSLHPIVELRSFLQGQIVAAENRGSMHRRSASDTLATIMKSPFFAEEGASKSVNKERDFDLNVKLSEDSTKSDSEKMDHKKMKRVLANRASAQRSRQKRLDYVEKLKTNISICQAKLATLTPKMALCEAERAALLKENVEIKQRLDILAIETTEKAAAYERLKKERDMLVLNYFQQKDST